MPNWCSTHMKVVGDDHEIKKFLDGIAKDDAGNYSILKTYYPCPEKLYDTIHGFFRDEDHQASLVVVHAENIANYGYADWYDWCVDNWGTKWGDCETELLFYSVGEAVFTLDSAWSPITKGMEEISKKFPNLYFAFDHIEEAGFYAGSELIHNGKVIAEAFFSPEEEYETEFPDPDNPEAVQEFFEAYGEWVGERVRNMRENMRLELRMLGLNLNVFSETD